MKAISLTSPFGHLMAISAKRIETRGWSTHHRGDIAICSTKDFPRPCKRLCNQEPFRSCLIAGGLPFSSQLPLGRVLAVGNLVRVFRFTSDSIRTISEQERAFGDYTLGRYGFVVENIFRLPKAIPVRGALGIFDLDADVEKLVDEQLAATGRAT